ncbi:MAG: serine/threonine-protein kinase, partial [Lachnospiraceae bacterium]|nr:serine/threonine-protein kinase [Lachnospiraceae bacterium]
HGNTEDSAPLDKICYQSYSVGSYVDKGTVIDLKVSIGPSARSYRYADNITAPTEDPDYRNGMNVTVTIITADGTQLLNTQTSSFPVGVNYTGIKSETGTIQFKFIVTTEATTTTNPDTGEVTTTEGTSMEKTVNREITFTAE